MNLFDAYNINYKIINADTNTCYSISEFKQSENIKHIIQSIKSLNIDALSISEAYDFLYNLQKKLMNYK